MIVAVDDDAVYRNLIETALTAAGFEVVTFPGPAEALDNIPKLDVDLIISDIRMPGMDGLAFKAALESKRPDLEVPFIFLSSMGEPEQIVAGLEACADDYLTKPIDPRVLTAKVRTILNRTRTARPAVFRGDLARFPFVQLLQLCEQHALTGQIELDAPAFKAVIPMRGGQIVFDELEHSEELLERIYDLDEGRFVIRQHTIDFSHFDTTGSAPTEGGTSGRTLPAELATTAGTLSALHLEGRTFQVQTEVVSRPEPAIETTVTTGGKVILHRRTRLGDPGGADALEKRVTTQHTEIEDEVRRRVMELVSQKAGQSQPGSTEMFYDLFEQGLAAYQRKDFANAAAAWERALEIKPGDTTLTINLNIVRSKLKHH